MAYYVADRKTREAILAARVEQHQRNLAVFDAALARHRAERAAAAERPSV